MIQLDLKITQIEGFNENHLWMMIKIVDIMKRYRKTKFKIKTLCSYTNWGKDKVIKIGRELKELNLLTIENTTKAYGGQGANLYKITTSFISYLENLEGQTFDLSDESTVSENQNPVVDDEDDIPLDVVGTAVGKSATAVSENQPPISKPINLPNSLKGEAPQNFSEKTQQQNSEVTEKLNELFSIIGIDFNNPLAYPIAQAIESKPAAEVLDYLEYLLTVEAQKPDFKERKTRRGEPVRFVSAAYSQWFYQSFHSWKIEGKKAPPPDPGIAFENHAKETKAYLDEINQKAIRDPAKIKAGIEVMKQAMMAVKST